MTDPIADMLTRIRNAVRARKETVDVPLSRLKRELARILKDEGYIRDYRVMQEGPRGTLRLFLKYGPEKEAVITELQRVSRPGRRVYARHDRLPRVQGGFGIAVVSTSRGIMTDRQARRERLGGEVICYVW